MDRAEFFKMLSSFSPQERAAMGFAAPSSAAAPEAHKWVALADGVPDAQVAAVVNACRAGVQYVAAHPDDPEADGKGWQHLADVNGALAAAARASSLKRGKPLVWSLGRIAEYLQSETADQKRAAARRRVPAAAPATPAAPAESAGGKGGGK